MKQKVDGGFGAYLHGVPYLSWVNLRLESTSGKVTRVRGFLLGCFLLGFASVDVEP